MQNMNSKPRVIVLDVSKCIEWFMQEVASCGDNPRGLYVNDIFITALRFLHFSHNTREASGALLTDLCDIYYPDLEPHNKADRERLDKLDKACGYFVREIHQQLINAGAYDESEQLTYTIGGWMQTYSPYLVKTSDINNFAKPTPLIVQSQYEIPEDVYTDNSDNPGYWNPARYLNVSTKY
jgi:hypothetical protein